jgi:hypothetical protein
LDMGSPFRFSVTASITACVVQLKEILIVFRDCFEGLRLATTVIDKRLDDGGGAGAACRTSPLWVLGFPVAKLRYTVSWPKIGTFAN